ncbi:DUF1653 domain-containing protein [Candidatus Woesearchaeota archaeon]|nr:DUF1653 domain-containing protein [Candidatus Woesearchaeota archaeon]
MNKTILPKEKYKHYKGQMYEIIGVGKDSTTLTDVVIYKALYFSEEFGDNAIWVRPKKEFLEIIEKDGKKMPRFEKIDIELYK